MAQIIARMLAKEDQLNAQQRATLDKLAGEYADELANLGIRVSNLEKKVGKPRMVRRCSYAVPEKH
jgi:dihydroneopterin aldolase